jgi:uncharacterized protein (DUF885 family)
MTQTRTVDELADGFVVEAAALDPVSATGLGILEHEHDLTDYSPEGFAARRDLVTTTLDALGRLTPLDDREAVAQSAMTERLQAQADRYRAGVVDMQLSVLSGAMHEIRDVFDLMATVTDAELEAIADRLAAVPTALSGWRATLLECADEGRVAARRQVLGCADQAERWTGDGHGAGDMFGDLVRGLSPGPALRPRLDRAAAAARTAYGELATFLRTELAPRAPEEDAVGRDAYAPALRYYLGTSVDLDETYVWGFDELARIEAEMAATADRIVPGGSVDEAVAALDADPGRWLSGGEAFRDWMQVRADAALAALADVHFDIPEPVRRIECRLAPTHEGGIYYTGPSEDFERPGRMWWSVPQGVERFSTWRELTTVHHEGVPGHHLQVAQTIYRSELLNRWQRVMCWVSGHGEGWALYAERLMAELGHLDDPGDHLGMLDSQAFRAVRVIVDIGMHLRLEIPADNPFGFHPGQRWTPELGLEFLRAHCRVDDPTLRYERDRYLGLPGQAPSYKIGERFWLQARADAEQRLGTGFVLRDFHRQALDLGSLGLDPMRAALGLA